MKILVYFFTGSGNTERVLKKFESEFQKCGHSVDFVKIENQVYKVKNKINVNHDEYDLIGIGYPIHAFNAPKIMYDWVKTLEPLKNQKRTFIINTSAEPLIVNHASAIKFSRKLRKKGFDVQNEYHYVMPYDMIFRHKQQMAYKMWDTAQKLITIDAKTILEGKSELYKQVKGAAFYAWVLRIEHFGSQFNGIFYRVDKKKCIKCHKCVNNCPIENIRLKNGEIKFGTKCTMCQRCTYFCPTDAIKTGMFNSWRVNTPYTFEYTEDPEAYDNTNPINVKRANFYNGFWCKSVYVRYFKEAEEKIAKYYK